MRSKRLSLNRSREIFWLTNNPVADFLNQLPGSDTVDEWGRKLLPWRRGESTQYGQSVRRPQATKAGAALLGWLQPKLTQLEAMYNLPAGLLRSVALTESGGNQFAVSGAGAKGLFQFMHGTARDMGLRGDDVFDPSKSAAAAARYLGMLLRMNGGDLEKRWRPITGDRQRSEARHGADAGGDA